MAEIDWAEARRYLGYRSEPPAPEVERALQSCGAELMRAVSPRVIWKRAALELKESSLRIAGIPVRSTSLRRHLDGCTGAVLFAATLGVEADRLIHRASVSGMSRAVLLQACAASLLEAWCDECCEQIAREEAPLFLRPRFSPGYGDFSITHQQDLLALLDAQKRIGVTVTDGMMLAPVKSVTAIIGLTPSQALSCPSGKCMTCPMTSCPFRTA